MFSPVTSYCLDSAGVWGDCLCSFVSYLMAKALTSYLMLCMLVHTCIFMCMSCIIHWVSNWEDVHASKFRGWKVVLIRRQRDSRGAVPLTRTEPSWIQWFLEPMSHRGCLSMETTLVFEHKMKVFVVFSPVTRMCVCSQWKVIMCVYVCVMHYIHSFELLTMSVYPFSHLKYVTYIY